MPWLQSNGYSYLRERMAKHREGGGGDILGWKLLGAVSTPNLESFARCLTSQESPLSLFADMAEKGILFSDGMEDDCVVFGAGMEVEIGVVAQQGRLVV